MHNNHDDNPMYWLRRIQLATRHALDGEFSCHGMTGIQMEVLMRLWRHDGLEQRELQEMLGVTSATLTGILDGMVEREVVERRLSPEDARVKQIWLTERGRELQQNMGSAFESVEARLLRGFSRAEVALLNDWLRRLATNMGAAGEHCD